jgi:hypothetical protein
VTTVPQALALKSARALAAEVIEKCAEAPTLDPYGLVKATARAVQHLADLCESMLRERGK